ncbi:DUF4340 domain-containing protein [Agaribacter marinus]|uniref:DUF4340 domain-containing protein n=1 Tax=Agaribacter marinus TaxID=1431249 RepID=A0AA37T019_9ALTE|nr:DUF4340 domain-containing protein [Agaribacter marinus]GLR73003.1 hypothetical protein GCM10007852_39110 [Agaribacter marinus]
MQKQLIAILIVLVVLVAGAVLSLNMEQKDIDPADDSNQALINASFRDADLIAVRIENAGGLLFQASKQTDNNTWYATHLADDLPYPIEKSLLASFVQTSMDANLVEAKSKRAENRARLGLSAITESDSAATLVNLEFSTGKVALLLGNQASIQNGQYLRYADESQMWLTDKSFSLPSDQYAWLSPNMLNLELADVKSLKRLGDETAWVIRSKEPADTGDSGFVLENFNEEEDELRFASIVDDVVESVMSLDFISVSTMTAEQWQDNAILASYEIEDIQGNIHSLRLIQESERYFAHFNTHGEQAYVNEWVYELQDYQARELLKTFDDFLVEKPVEAE